MASRMINATILIHLPSALGAFPRSDSNVSSRWSPDKVQSESPREDHMPDDRPLQNRVTPTGEIVSHPGRGLMMGNRGCLHGPDRALGAARRRWLDPAVVVRWLRDPDPGLAPHGGRSPHSSEHGDHDRRGLPPGAPPQRWKRCSRRCGAPPSVRRSLGGRLRR